VPLECLTQEALSSGEIAPLAEPELDRVAVAINGAVEIFPLASDFDVGLIHVPSPTDSSLAPVELLDQERGVVDRPAMDCGMIHLDASFSHHLFQVPQAQATGQIPADAEQDH
jgi:hypothetical protein